MWYYEGVAREGMRGYVAEGLDFALLMMMGPARFESWKQKCVNRLQILSILTHFTLTDLQ